MVEKVMYSGDEDGILCMLQGSATDKTVVGASLTHLIIDPAHPLAAAVSAYQQQRIRQLRFARPARLCGPSQSSRARKEAEKTKPLWHLTNKKPSVRRTEGFPNYSIVINR
ncbi:MAG: hypothetical protein WA883_18190 [Phormidesmis sp.]